MKKTLSILFAASGLLLASCGGGKNGWPEEAITQMKEGCESASSKEVCDCYVGKVVDTFTPEQVSENTDKVMDMMLECSGMGSGSEEAAE